MKINTKQLLLEYTAKSIKQAQEHFKILRLTFDFSDFSTQLKIETPMSKSEQIFSFNSLITIGKLETAIQLKNIVSEESNWEQIYFIKQAYSTIKQTLETYKIYPEQLNDFVLANPELTDLWKEVNKEYLNFETILAQETNFDEIISNTVVNITSDFKKYYDLLIEINKEKALEFILEFHFLLEKMFIFSVECLEADTDKAKMISPEEITNKIKEVSLRLDTIRNAFRNLN